jgi:DNA-binding NarL/FixJ family response regulator
MKKLPQNPVLQVLIVDDHWMVRDGLKLMLKAPKKKYRFKIAEAENGTKAIEKASKNDFDLILLDYRMPDMEGAAVAEKMLAINPLVKILALSNYNEVSNVEKMIASGAHGYILKNIGPADLLAAIRTVMGGGSYYSNEVYSKLFEARQRNWQKVTLSSRELEVLQLIAQGKTSDQIARQLSLEKSTIDSHRSHLLAKFEVKNTIGLLKEAFERGLLT